MPPLLSTLLNKWGYNSIHTTHFADGHLLNDNAIREIAISSNRIIVTKDSDFYEYYHVRGSPPVVLMITMGNISNSQLFHQLQNHKASIEKLFLDGYGLVIFDGQNLISF